MRDRCGWGRAPAAGTLVWAGWLLTAALAQEASAQALPAGWTGEDIANTVAGTSAFDAGTGVWTVDGEGGDIWNNADQFRYTHRALSGDGVIEARVLSVEATDGWAKAGVMIRQSTAAGSAHGLSCMTPANGTSYQRRLATDGASASDNTGGLAAPYWVRLVRAGDSFTAFSSADGTTWTQTGAAQTIPMGGADVRVGLAVTSHVGGTLCTATFDRVRVTQGGVVLFEWLPAAPVLTGTPGDALASLSWTAVTGATAYNVYFGTATGVYGPTAIYSGTALAYLRTGLTNGANYYFIVRAVVGGLEGADSNEVLVVPAAPPPPPPRYNDHEEGTLDGRCACGSASPSGLTALLAGLVFLLLPGRRRR